MTDRQTTETTPARVYKFTAEETRDWVTDAEGDGNAFTRKSLSTNEKPGTRIELYATDGHLLEAFTVG